MSVCVCVGGGIGVGVEGVEGVHTCVCSRVHVLYTDSTIIYSARDIHVTSYGTGARYLNSLVCVYIRDIILLFQNKIEKNRAENTGI